jgi:hypothetical protein
VGQGVQILWKTPTRQLQHPSNTAVNQICSLLMIFERIAPEKKHRLYTKKK